jgi:branched-chain amino acid aminotransferase
LPLAFADVLSVFESLRAYGGKILCLEEHLRRLLDSSKALARPLPLPAKELGAWLKASLKESGFADATMRVSVHWKDAHGGEIVLFVRHFVSHPKEWYENGVTLATTVGRRASPRAQDVQAKSSQYVGGVLAYLDAARPPHEFLFLGPDGTAAEGTVSNVFIVKRKCLLTPPAASGILKGVTRDLVLASGARCGLRTLETPLTRHDLYTADECFITNTSSEVLPVVAVDGRRIADGRPGRWTKALGRDFQRQR